MGIALLGLNAKLPKISWILGLVDPQAVASPTGKKFNSVDPLSLRAVVRRVACSFGYD